jgi:hypothetical protein
MKLLEKTRIGSKLKRRYDKPQTPLFRPDLEIALNHRSRTLPLILYILSFTYFPMLGGCHPLSFSL